MLGFGFMILGRVEGTVCGAGSDYAELGVVVVVVGGGSTLKVSGGTSQSAGHERPGPNSLMGFRHKPPKHGSLKKDTLCLLFVH